MTKKLFWVLALILLASSALCAQTPGYPTQGGHWVPLAAGISMAIASGLCGLGQGKAVASAVEGMGRNPGAATKILVQAILAIAFAEAIVFYALFLVR